MAIIMPTKSVTDQMVAAGQIAPGSWATQNPYPEEVPDYAQADGSGAINVVRVDPATQAAAPVDQPPVMPPPPMFGGADIGGLNRQANVIGKAGEASLKSAADSEEQMVTLGQEHKNYINAAADVDKKRAEASANDYDAQVRAVAKYQADRETNKKAEAEAVATADKERAEKVEDAIHGNMTRDQRKAEQAIVNSKDASPTQRAAAQARLDKAKDIDPNQALGGNLGVEITAALAMGLGAYASAMGGGPNYAMQIINKAIDDNIDAQKHKFAKRRAEADDAKANVADVKASYRDERLDMLEQKEIALELGKLKLSKVAAGLDGTAAGANADLMKSQFDMEIAKTQQAYAQVALSNHQQAQVQKGALMAEAAQLANQREAVAASGAGGDKKAQAEVAAMAGDIDSIYKQIDSINAIRKDVGREVFGTDKAKEASAKAATLMIDIGKNVLKLGVLSGPDLEILKTIVPEDPTALRQDVVEAKMVALKKFIGDKLGSFATARGVSMGAPAPGVPGEVVNQ